MRRQQNPVVLNSQYTLKFNDKSISQIKASVNIYAQYWTPSPSPPEATGANPEIDAHCSAPKTMSSNNTVYTPSALTSTSPIQRGLRCAIRRTGERREWRQGLHFCDIQGNNSLGFGFGRVVVRREGQRRRSNGEHKQRKESHCLKSCARQSPRDARSISVVFYRLGPGLSCRRVLFSKPCSLLARKSRYVPAGRVQSCLMAVRCNLADRGSRHLQDQSNREPARNSGTHRISRIPAQCKRPLLRMDAQST